MAPPPFLLRRRLLLSEVTGPRRVVFHFYRRSVRYKKEVEMMLSVARTYHKKSKVSSQEKAESNPSPA